MALPPAGAVRYSGLTMDSVPEESKALRELGVYRDTVESVGVAIILAFVLRAFVIEAFVIPTGSMAPRLLGEHWDVACPTCGYSFAYGSSAGLGPDKATLPSGARCPNCRTPIDSNYPPYRSSGDRVLVMKYIYNFAPPQPWDVVVFKNPQDNRENYIKRLIGLPGETIEIVHGDIFVSDGPDPARPRRIRRKPPKAQEAMWQVVFDNDYRPDPARPGAGQAPRWAPARAAREANSWDLAGSDGRCFAFRGGAEAAELFFQADPSVFHPNYGYNYPESDERQFDPRVDVCTDLKLSAVLMPKDGPSSVTLRLSSFHNRFDAEFRTDGNVFLRCVSPDLPGGQFSKPPVQVAPFEPGKGRVIALTNADFQAVVWVDGQRVLETTDQEYPCPEGPDVPGRFYRGLLRQLGEPVPAPEVKVMAQGSPCELRHVALHRDEYYTSAKVEPIPQGPVGEYVRAINKAHEDPNVGAWRHLAANDVRHRAVADGRGWGTAGNPITLARNAQDPDLDEFFCLGDNSPQSRDGRSWTSAAPTLRLYGDDNSFVYQLGTVPRYNLLGKAMFVYWPGGFRLPLLENLPIVPNVGKMRFIQ